MDDNEIRSMLVDIVEKGDFPSDTLEVFHLERIDNFFPSRPNKVRFWIERHPHLFGAPTRGLASSIFIPIRYCYELDLETKRVTLIKKEEDEPVINYFPLALEQVDSFFTNGDYELPDDIRAEESKERVRILAEREFYEFNFGYDDYDGDGRLPENFYEKILNEIKKQFIEHILFLWESKQWLEDI
ncbi:MAG: hypothetical protein KAU38_02760 [Desulfobacterales bacterium]|nr:hypothetical protein [Desulfobacterales bacterium]